MSKLAQVMAKWVAGDMAREIQSLSGANRECRAVFCGPPPELLQQVFSELAGDGRLIVASTADGGMIDYPVILQVDSIPEGAIEAHARQSGMLLPQGMVNIRNIRECGVYVTLMPPGGQVSDSLDSTRKAFGVSPEVNEGSGSISTWWNDGFIQSLVEGAIEDGSAKEKDEARRLLASAVAAADAADQHSVARPGAWAILDRLWAMKGKGLGIDARVSLAAGFPPSSTGVIDAEDKEKALRSLVDNFEESSYGRGTEQLKAKARDDVERAHLDEFQRHIRRKCEVVTALRRSMSFFYAPDQIDPPPGWWEALSVDRWLQLLEDSVEPPSNAAATISCVNPLVSHLKGIVPIVRGVTRIRVDLPEGVGPIDVFVTREGGGAANRREWRFPAVQRSVEFEDDSLPSHKTPIKYVAEIVGSSAKKGALRLISLDTWEPGIIVCSRTATKGAVPKTAKAGLIETSLLMSGHGRHYLDVYMRPGVKVVSDKAEGSSDDSQEIASADIGLVADDEYGLEVEVASEAFYRIEIQRPEAAKPEVVQVHLTADEVDPEECSSHFELLLLQNSRGEGGRRAVHINGQLRSSQLQGWMLEEERVARSFYPIVLASDYASEWRRREWTGAADTIFSSGRFLNDPRPTFDEMRPPEAFVNARESIARRIRGADGNDLIEAAPLGEWLVTDAEFSEQVDAYVRSYADWLSSDPTVAAWCDIGLVTRFESDGMTLHQEADAIVVSPLHPLRLAWHCVAQRAMYLAARKRPCPAASILDPDCVPDSIPLPMRNATGGISNVSFFSVECSSDYWGILWNADRLDQLAKAGAAAPLDREMGLLVGGISSGFSVSQVHRALDDVCAMLVAKPVVGVMVSSAAGQNNACNEGILSWGRKHFGGQDSSRRRVSAFGASEVHVLDERRQEARPDDAEISNIAEDTDNAIQWFSGSAANDSPDLAIIAQLETSNASALPTKLASPISFGGLTRIRIRQQLQAASGQLLCESRMAGPARPTGDGLSDNLAKALSNLENLSVERTGYVFAPSVHAVTSALEKAEFAAVSSSAVDPACFLGSWLEGTYLWDYELPSYSGRSGDSNGYYLLSRIKPLDLDTLRTVLQRLPGCGTLTEGALAGIVQEVARRGIPTVRGLSAGDSGATGDLGLLVATRLLQDSFRGKGEGDGLLSPWAEVNGEQLVTLVIPVDPFQGYLDDLAKAIKKPTLHRPDLVVVALRIGVSSVTCKVTPVEVKNRGAGSQMSASGRMDALSQARSLSTLLEGLGKTFSEEPEMVLWRLAYQNLLSSMIGYGFRVYSQQLAQAGRSAEWSELHAKVMESLLASEVVVEIDANGRLVVIDGSPASGPRDTDGDGFHETIELSQSDASAIVRGEAGSIFEAIRNRLGDWRMIPGAVARVPQQASSVEDVTDVPATDVAGPEDSRAPGQDEPEAAAPPSVMQAPGPSAIAQAPQPSPEPALAPASNDGSEQTGLDLRVGETLDGFQQQLRWLNLGNTSLNQLNMGVVGDLGTGKTQLLKSLVFQIATGEKGNRGVKPNVLIFDYKKDYRAEDFVDAVGARVIRPQHLPINLFDLSGAAQSITPWLERYRFFADVLGKIYSGIGPVQLGRLKSSIRDEYAAAGNGRYPSIYDIYRNYSDALKGADAVTSILGDLVDMELFTPDPGKVIPSDEFFNGVVVIALDELGQDDRTKNMLVAIMLNLFYERMLRIPKRPFLGKNKNMRVVDSMLLVDEADNIMQYEFDVLRKVLLQGREFGVGVILASQYLSHFKVGGTDYREPLLSWFVHKVPNIRPQELGALGLGDSSNFPQMAERIKGLGLHECLYKTHDVSGEFVKGAPFYRRLEW